MTGMDIELRPAGPADLDRCAGIEQAAFGDEGYNRITLRQFLDIAGDLFTVAAGDAGIMGYALAAPSTEKDLAWLLSVAVDGPYRNLGAGRRLVTHTLARCAAYGFARVRVTVHPDNGPSISVMRSLNFTEIGEEPHYFGPGEPRRILEVAPGEA